jgi:nucleotide-binding universal stress UspA family protein
MSEVILVVSGRRERQDGLLAAANRLGALTGEGRVRMLGLGSAVLPGAGVAAELLPAGADVVAEVETRGSRADFVVVAQPASDDDRATRDAFRAALLRTERPVLMVPSSGGSGAFGRRVAIAWRDDARTLKALVPALRLLSSAEQVHLLAGVRAGMPTPAIPPVLIEHGVAVTLHVLAIDSSSFGELLLARARELGADLLVIGAYAHGPLPDLLLGGVTRTVLAKADLPVLMRY